jgi:hypothetical protein
MRGCILEAVVKRTCLAFLAFSAVAVLSASSASAQFATAIAACSRDMAEFCNSAKSNGNRLAECTKAHFQDFRDPCRKALMRITAVREACRTDVREQCPGLKVGAGRLLLCVRRHYSSLSEPCKDAIAHAALRERRLTTSGTAAKN